MPFPSCSEDSQGTYDNSAAWIWDSNWRWDAHRIGWTVAAGCAFLTVIISSLSVLQHCRNYTARNAQRQIIRILYMPPIYAIISFFSYRFFRDYTYYSLVEVVYEAVTLSAFLLLLIEYVAATALGHDARNAVSRKHKQTLPLPFCCWRYRPSKPYFMYALKWSVLQYVVVRPATTIAGIIAEKFNVLCPSRSLDFRYASVYLSIVDFISCSVALYGLLVFYDLTSVELRGHRPLAKFLCIKLLIVCTFYQEFLFACLENRVIHATKYWSTTDIANGLNALCICVEMVFFSCCMWWAYTPNEFKRKSGEAPTRIWKPLWDSINYTDFLLEILSSLGFFIAYAKGEPGTHGDKRANFGAAFGVDGTSPMQIKSIAEDESDIGP